VERYRGPLILDADALNAFEGATERLTGYGALRDPHTASRRDGTPSWERLSKKSRKIA